MTTEPTMETERPRGGPDHHGARQPEPGGARDLHRVEQVMGTVVSVSVRSPDLDRAALHRLFAYLHEVDRRFSPYKPDSEVSRLIRGELSEADASPDLRAILGLCEDLHRTSGGYFDIRSHRADGRPDPTGLVKGWAVEQASWLLESAGARDYHLNAGGDVIAAGEAEPGRAWRVGIRHPRQVDRLAAVLAVRDRAVATSGAYERGQHIVDPHTGRPPQGLTSLTVVGPSLTWADAYATAGFAMGLEGLGWVAGHPGYGAYGITEDDRVLWTAELDGLLA